MEMLRSRQRFTIQLQRLELKQRGTGLLVTVNRKFGPRKRAEAGEFR